MLTGRECAAVSPQTWTAAVKSIVEVQKKKKNVDQVVLMTSAGRRGGRSPRSLL